MGTETSASRYLSIHAFMFFVAITLLLWLATLLGGQLRKRRERTLPEESSTFKTLESAVLALLGLLLGFTFSMGVGRYDQRKNLEIAEANSLANAWLRTSTLPEPLRSQEQQLMRRYVPVRLQFLSAGTSATRIDESLRGADGLQSSMWGIAAHFANSRPDPISAQYLSAVTDMIDISESRTAAFENRIPILAWAMLVFIGCIASVLVGVGVGTRSQLLRLVLPIVVASALSLILDLDSPRSGLIRVHQYSLDRVAARINTGPLP